MKILIATVLVLCATPAIAQIPQTLHHQGRIASGGENVDGPGQFKFLLYATKTSGSLLGPIWKNDDSNPTTMAEPTAAVSTTVTKGLYSVALGEIPQAPLTGDLLQPMVLLRIWFDDGVNGFQQLAPDRKIASVPFARHADITGQSVSLLNNDAGYVVSEDFDFALESDTRTFTETELGGTSGSFSTSFTFTETFTDPPAVLLEQTNGISNPLVSNVTTTGFDLDFDFTFPIGPNPMPATEPWPHFDLVQLGSEVGVLFAEGPIAVTPSTVMGTPVNEIDSYPDLNFIRADDELGSNWNSPLTLGSAYARSQPNLSALSSTIRTFDGHLIASAPAAAYVAPSPLTINSSTGAVTGSARIMYRRSNDSLGTTWAAPVEIETLANNVDDFGDEYVGTIINFGVSMTEIGGLPAVLYNTPESFPSGFPPSGGVPPKVKFARASDVDGSSWQITDTGADPAELRSNLAKVDGKPAFVTAIFDSSDPVLTLRLHRASDATGTTWNTPLTIWAATSAEVGSLGSGTTSGTPDFLPHLALFNVAGRPAVAVSGSLFQDLDLRYLRASDAAGGTWPAPVMAATATPGTAITHMAAIADGGLPVIAYREANQLLRISAIDADGTSWTAPEALGSDLKGAVAMLAGPSGPITAASSFDTAPADVFVISGGNGVIPVVPTLGSISIFAEQPPSLDWTADDPADVQLQQQRLSLNGSNVTISGGNSIDLSPLLALDHGTLTGLLDDDHPQYFLGDGSEPFAGPMNLGGNALSGVSSLTVTGSVNLPSASISNNDLQSSVMIQGENVSLLNNDAGYISSTGNATLTGDLTISGDYKFTIPKAFTLRLPPTAFQPRAGGVLIQEDGSVTNNGRTVAAFELPPGATITSVSVLVDAPTAVITTIDFRCTDLSPGSSGTRTVLDNNSTNSTTGIAHVALGGTPITVGADELYSIDVKIDQSTLYGARVTYTLDTLAP